MVTSLDALDVGGRALWTIRNDVSALQNRIHFLLREGVAWTTSLAARSGAPTRYQLNCSTSSELPLSPHGIRVNNVANRYEIDMTVNVRPAAESAVPARWCCNGSAPVIVDLRLGRSALCGHGGRRTRRGDQRATESGGDPDPAGPVALFRRTARRREPCDHRDPGSGHLDRHRQALTAGSPL